ncbi:hypothetical protein A3A76_04010 [Candidatus Woesebacteria bacterium RIFCSPLOWO2_01_FULL_39_23]|uniref:Uncharacterized protein n=1 Tax=Candidatus Woesebacteria bacterium RIFCSPHIGHO2_01_FULL_40_22 TaxID=1802499 RepID=A0A1F7YGE0_9BACT|nr:MAG: hypothetical protein A2141_03605 [Candidatus Woesebacteria bacterium RBG_16_40_11]OGM26397.1 MAG: hypothetical protein A2628_00010 [Candidatus Woesebacteria bacterium RIFCSPHIGHO2_01_FULL_40_22]OGM36029.1 MAG: hypothetical protein A3E41_00345 [Candidatus Woesebacteria bacterium RIFCSPHIGHO2_12_FULL_38_9]OGM61980.1 MAG: hypothetical protein A3A76_04010 [Candidatus Woesebacteria bacterium RIFCSPLOWO2_01_FULL_39_23]
MLDKGLGVDCFEKVAWQGGEIGAVHDQIGCGCGTGVDVKEIFQVDLTATYMQVLAPCVKCV